ncbi:hypothetical protein [Williamsia sp. M5A3_1d]
MHLGIIVFMGLAAFGLIMIGADSMLLTDRDYQTLVDRLRRGTRAARNRFGASTDRKAVATASASATDAPAGAPRERVGV